MRTQSTLRRPVLTVALVMGAALFTGACDDGPADEPPDEPDEAAEAADEEPDEAADEADEAADDDANDDAPATVAGEPMYIAGHVCEERGGWRDLAGSTDRLVSEFDDGSTLSVIQSVDDDEVYAVAFDYPSENGQVPQYRALAADGFDGHADLVPEVRSSGELHLAPDSDLAEERHPDGITVAWDIDC